MAGIEQMDLGVRIIASKGLGTGGQEKRVILAPNREKRRPPGADVFLEFGIERDIAPVIAEQIELDLGDDLALDFLNSVTALWQEIEWLRNGGGLVAWLEQAHAMSADMAAHFRADAKLRALDAVASQARERREWFRTFVSDHVGKPLDPAALNELAPLNQLLGRDEPYRGNDRWRRAWRIALATKASLTDA
jgi:hypothetical protein